MPTKTEYEAEIAALKEKVQELEIRLAERDAALSESGQDGWLITTPNKGYTGITAGVDFRNGQAFVPVGFPDVRNVLATLMFDFGYEVVRMTASDYKEALRREPNNNGKKSLAELMGGING